MEDQEIERLLEGNESVEAYIVEENKALYCSS